MPRNKKATTEAVTEAIMCRHPRFPRYAVRMDANGSGRSGGDHMLVPTLVVYPAIGTRELIAHIPEITKSQHIDHPQSAQ